MEASKALDEPTEGDGGKKEGKSEEDIDKPQLPPKAASSTPLSAREQRSNDGSLATSSLGLPSDVCLPKAEAVLCPKAVAEKSGGSINPKDHEESQKSQEDTEKPLLLHDEAPSDKKPKRVFSWLSVIAKEKKNLDMAFKASGFQHAESDSNSSPSTPSAVETFQFSPTGPVSSPPTVVLDPSDDVLEHILLKDRADLCIICDCSKIEQRDEQEVFAKYGIVKFSPSSSSEGFKSPAKTTTSESLTKERLVKQVDEENVELESPTRQREIELSTAAQNVSVRPKATAYSPVADSSSRSDRSRESARDPENTIEIEPKKLSLNVGVEEKHGGSTQIRKTDVDTSDEAVGEQHKATSPHQAQVSPSQEKIVPTTEHLYSPISFMEPISLHKKDASYGMRSPSRLPAVDESQDAWKYDSSLTTRPRSTGYFHARTMMTYGYESPYSETYKRYKLHLLAELNFNVEYIVEDEFEDRLNSDYYFLNQPKENGRYFLMEYIFAASECCNEVMDPRAVSKRSIFLIHTKVEEVLSEARRTLLYRIENETCLFYDDFFSICIEHDSFKPVFTRSLYKLAPRTVIFARDTLFSALLLYGVADLCFKCRRLEQCIAFAQLSYALVKKLYYVVGCIESTEVLTHLLKQRLITAFLHEELHSDEASYSSPSTAYKTILVYFKPKVEAICSMNIPHIYEGDVYPLMDFQPLKMHVTFGMPDWALDEQLVWENTWLKLVDLVSTMTAFFTHRTVFDEASNNLQLQELKGCYEKLDGYLRLLLNHDFLEATTELMGFYGVVRCMNAKHWPTYEERCTEYRNGRNVLVAAVNKERRQRPEFCYKTYTTIASSGLWLHLQVVMEDMWYKSDKTKFTRIVYLLDSIHYTAGSEVNENGIDNSAIAVMAGLLFLDYTYDVPKSFDLSGLSEWRDSCFKSLQYRSSETALKHVLAFLSETAATLWTLPRNRGEEVRSSTYLRMLKIVSLSFSAAFITFKSNSKKFKNEVKKVAKRFASSHKISHESFMPDSLLYGHEAVYLPAFLSRLENSSTMFKMSHLDITTEDPFHSSNVSSKPLFLPRNSAPEAKFFDDALKSSVKCIRDSSSYTESCALKNESEYHDVLKFRENVRKNCAVHHIRATKPEIERLKSLCSIQVFHEESQQNPYSYFLANVVEILKNANKFLTQERSTVQCPSVQKKIDLWNKAVLQALRFCQRGAADEEAFLLVMYKFCVLFSFPTEPYLHYLT